MARFKIQDIYTLESSPTSPSTLRNKISEMIMSSTNAKCKVDSINPETWEYRIIVHGTLDKEETPWDQNY